MSAPTILGPVEPMVFRPTVVDLRRWNIAERTVPPVVPSFDEPCPDRDGSGFTAGLYMHVGACQCEPAGVVQRVWRAERQCQWGDDWERLVHADLDTYELPSATTFRHVVIDPEVRDWWELRHPGCAPAVRMGPLPTRLAVVSWYSVTKYEVIDQDHPLACLDFDDTSQHLLLLTEDEEGLYDITNSPEPWAADLEPGCVVVIPGDEVRLDTPITEMRVECDADWSPCDEGICLNNPCGVSVPLALEDGLNEVKLAR